MAISLLVQILMILILLSAANTATTDAHTSIQCLEHQKALLLDLKKQLVFNSSLSSILVQWNRMDDCCRWNGVECDEAGRVTSLQLYSEGISGGLNESSSLFSLNYLEKLDLSYNLLEESEIPRHIHKLTHLTSLILSGCSLKGYFSQMIFQLPNLQVLDLSYNPLLSGTLPQIFPPNNSFTIIALAYTNFSGSLHAHAITNLRRVSRLELSNCQFTGVIPFTLSNLTLLEVLDLSANFFTGSISSIHFEPLSKVVYMDLSYNSVSGTIPVSIFTLPSLQELKLSDNQFSGKVGEFSILNNSGLSYLDLSRNRLESPIPNSFFNLQSLTQLHLSHNLFNESFELEKILSLSELEHLDLSNNSLSLNTSSSSNIFPVNQSSSSSSSLIFLDLSDNKITGEIPGWIWEIGSLVYLKLCCNMVVGLQKRPISTSNSFSSLEALDLSNNRIAGEIPSWIWEIGNGSLSYLNLSSNMLVDLQKPYHIPPSLTLYNLDLHSNHLRGELPYSLLQRAYDVDLSNNYFDKFNTGNFSTSLLSYLSLQNNSLSGLLLPTFFCNTRSLEVLDLSVNNLNGSIPHCLFENIKMLNLRRNNISGRIPDKFSQNNCRLVSLDLSDNDLVGDVPISLQNCKSLVVLNLSYNKLNGTVPTFLGQLQSLAVLNLGKNNITGRVPDFTAADCPLQYLVLNSNNITGEVPASLANCTSLEVVNLGNNLIEDTFPCMLPSTLRVLVLRFNRFHGEIGCHNKTWPNLQIIDIAYNDFTGYLNPFNFSTWEGMMRHTATKLSYKILDFNHYNFGYYREEVTLTIKGVEQKLVKIWPDFTSIDLSSNNFKGYIPDSIGGLDGLYLLNLSRNGLNGLIPKSFGNMTWLGALDISMNQLTGKIPKELGGLTFLQLMNVSHNKLVGQIPVSTQIQSFSPNCFEGNAGLCGLPLNITCSNTKPAVPVPNNGNVESEIEWEYVFAAAGYAVGLGIISWVLLFCSSFREIYFEKAEDVFHKMFSFCKHKKKTRNGGRTVVRK